MHISAPAPANPPSETSDRPLATETPAPAEAGGAEDEGIRRSVPPLDLSRFISSLYAYLKPEDVSRIGEAYVFAEMAHAGQFRVSGDPYVSHPLAVACILAEWHLDTQALIAALLHDVMEDTGITKAEIAERFGKTVAELVDGVSKLDRIEYQTYVEAQAENFRKMLMAMARDLRVVLIKLADRLHNMRTLDYVRPEKRRRVATETLEIYAPIANRLGLNTLYRELQDLSFRHRYPMRYRVLTRAVKSARGNRREVVGKILEAIKARLSESGIEAAVVGREKTTFSIYRKMHEKSLSFSQVLDIYGFRVVVPDVPSCYLALGALHGLFKPVPGKFKDYLAIPKANGYQSLHTTLIGPYGTPVEVQIRTSEMNHVAESGVASHWLYKDDDAAITELQKKTHKWLQSLLELQDATGDSAEFLEHVKIDLFPGEVYVFTPKGKILALPRGSSAVDFAYAVHTDIGNRCVACRINYDLMPLRTELSNGDVVDVITASHPSPNPAWLSYVKTGKARSQIRHFLKSRHYDESVQLGERFLKQALASQDASVERVGDSVWEAFLREAGAKSKQEVLADIGLGKRWAAVVARQLLGLAGNENASPKTPGAIVVHGTEGMAVQFARCCRPIPGDPIIGSIKKGQGLVVHTHDCPSIRSSRTGDPDKWVDVAWEPEPGKLFDVRIRIEAQNRRGVLAQIAAEIADSGSNIENVSMEEERGAYAALNFTIQVAHRAHLAKVMRAMRRLPDVVRIARMKEQ